MVKSSESDVDRMLTFIRKSFLKNKVKVFALTLFGGEPMMNYPAIKYALPKIKQLCAEFDVQFYVLMVSNGLLLTKNNLSFMIENGLKHIQITLDGNKKIHDTKRIYPNGLGTFDRTIKTLNMLKDSFEQLQVTLRINIDKENHETIPDLLDDLIEYNMGHFAIDYGIIRDESDNDMKISSICYVDDELGDLLFDLWEVTKNKGFPVKPIPYKKYVYCGLNNEFSYTFTPEMKYYKCWEHVGNEFHCFGYLDKNSELVISNDRFYQWMNKNPVQIDQCRECKYLVNCGGGCSINSFNNFGKYDAPGCFKTRGVLEKQVLFMYKNKYI